MLLCFRPRKIETPIFCIVDYSIPRVGGVVLGLCKEDQWVLTDSLKSSLKQKFLLLTLQPSRLGPTRGFRAGEDGPLYHFFLTWM